jgi:hypothetical protein
MPNAVLYILPENHYDKLHQQRKADIASLAYYEALNMLLENVYDTDKSGNSGNCYGIEDSDSHKRASVLLHYIDATVQLLHKGLISDSLPNPPELQKARIAAMKELDSSDNAPAIPKNSTVKEELAQYIQNFPKSGEKEIEEKYLFYDRNSKMADNITNIVRSVLAKTNTPRLFVLSVGARHVDSEGLKFRKTYWGKKDLRTILGETISAGSKTVDVI